VTRNIILIGNPIAGGGAINKIQASEAILRNRGFHVNVRLTARRGDAEAFARQSANVPNALVIAAGGDGTYNEVANGLIKSEIPLAILPLGTTSVLARELCIPLNHEKALDIAIGGITRTVSVGKLSYGRERINSDDERRGEERSVRHFLLMAGLGIDAEAVYGVNAKLKKLSGKLAYILSGFNRLIKYTPEELVIDAAVEDRRDIEGGRFRLHPDHVVLSGNRLKTRGSISVISKAACYGGNFVITPDADMEEPFLYALVLHKKRKIDILHFVLTVVMGRPLSRKDISYFRTSEIMVNGSGRMQVDGEYAGRAPAKFEIVKDALKLVVPAQPDI
jgi:diacylglycerol kinase (ATP)